MADIVLFGGTSEGRLIAERFQNEFNKKKVSLCVSVATEYGASLIKESANVKVHTGAMDIDEMETFILEQGATLCVDATHPYAAVVTENIINVCEKIGVACVRVVRGELTYKDDEVCNGDNITVIAHAEANSEEMKNTGDSDINSDGATMENLSNWAIDENNDVFVVDSVAEAVDFLNKTEGNIFISTGSKELDKFTKLKNYRSRCVARVLSTLPVVRRCSVLGFEGKNLIAMQGPFSEEINYQMFSMYDIKWLVTKNSGKAGGFEEKCEAALRAGAKLVIIGRPEEQAKNLVGVEECLDIIKGIYLK